MFSSTPVWIRSSSVTAATAASNRFTTGVFGSSGKRIGSAARNMAGVHWRTDYTESIKLGQAEIDEFVFADTPVNETLVRDLAGGGFLGQQRNLVLVGGTDRVS